MEKEEIYNFVATMLETETFEDLLERFDLTPEEVFMLCFESGLVDEEVLRGLSRLL
ncbi:MAG: hypothetical protein KDH96_09305 [Candidatus Riesia sp.]|nr:hypothetical protein [Candidatus Riesia sp.]